MSGSWKIETAGNAIESVVGTMRSPGALDLKEVVTGWKEEMAERLIPVDFSLITDYIVRKTGRRLPEDLLAQLDFKELRWQMISLSGDNNLLLLGSTANLIDPDQALGSVMVEFGASSADRQPRIFGVNLSGVLSDNAGNPRVLAAKYDLTYPDLSPLKRVNVSIHPEQFVPLAHDNKFEWHSVIKGVPSRNNHDPRNTAALITGAMLEKTEAHTLALSANSLNSKGKDFGFEHNNFSSKYLVCEQSENRYQIGLSSGDGKWMVAVPSFLQA